MRHVTFAVLFYFLLLYPLSIISCTYSGKDTQHVQGLGFLPGEWADSEATTLLSALSVQQKVSQLIMTVIDGKTELPPYFYSHFRDTVPGAVLLFRYNVADTPRAFHDYLNTVQESFSTLGLPVLFALDHEGGVVYRTGSLTTRLPAQESIAGKYSASEAELIYREASSEIRLLGVHMNLAPVAETGTPDNIKFLGSRVFSSDKEKVIEYSSSAIKGINSAGIISTAKHFPGNSTEDPHSGNSRITLPRDVFTYQVLQPFKAVIKNRPGAVLVSHVIVECIDPEVPFCLSNEGVTGILRNDLEFDGLIVTDDLSMGAISSLGYDSAEAAVLAVYAGCDLLMTSDPDIRSISRFLAREYEADPSFAKRVDRAALRILKAKILAGLPITSLGRYAASKNLYGLPFDESLYEMARRNTERVLELP